MDQDMFRPVKLDKAKQLPDGRSWAFHAGFAGLRWILLPIIQAVPFEGISSGFSLLACSLPSLTVDVLVSSRLLLLLILCVRHFCDKFVCSVCLCAAGRCALQCWVRAKREVLSLYATGCCSWAYRTRQDSASVANRLDSSSK